MENKDEHILTDLRFPQPLPDPRPPDQPHGMFHILFFRIAVCGKCCIIAAI